MGKTLVSEDEIIALCLTALYVLKSMVKLPFAFISLSCAVLNLKSPLESTLNLSVPSVSTKNLPLDPVSVISAFELPSNILSAVDVPDPAAP